MLYAVLADDLTGAADAGVEFAQAGWRTRALRQPWQAADLAGAEVVVINTGSRACAPDEAYACVRRAAAQLAAAGAAVIYKKIDSTLRGPLGAELDAVLDACGFAQAIICPAFPAAGRILREGVLYVHGVPVAQTALSRDPVTPVQESHLPTLLAATAHRPVVQQPPLSALAATAGREGLLRALLHAGLIVVDALDEDDLASIAQAALAAPQPPLLAGSAGLARPLALALAQTNGKSNKNGKIDRHDNPRSGSLSLAPDGAPVLVVCGSLHPQARVQLRALQGQQASSTSVVLATPETPAAGQPPQTAAQVLAQEAAAWLQTHAAAALVVLGGDTLESLLAALDARGIDLECGLAPGIPLGRVTGGWAAGLRLVSKAGGFGDDGALVHIVNNLFNSSV